MTRPRADDQAPQAAVAGALAPASSAPAVEPWVPDPRLPHAFQQAQPVYIRTIHHQIFTTVCTLCGGGRRSRQHLAAEEREGSRWPI